MTPEVVPSRTPYLQACPDPVPGAVTLTDLEGLDAWVLRVAQGEVTPRDVAERVRAIVAEMRAILVREKQAPTGPAMMPLGDDWLTVREASRILGITTAGVHARIRRQQLPRGILKQCRGKMSTWQINHQGLITWLAAREGKR
jgi:hypothetical protein